MWQASQYVPFADAPDPRPGCRARLDREHYAGRQTMAREWELMWQKVWLLAGVEQDVSEAGEFFTFDIGTESVLVTRGEDGVLHAHFNVCQHRGNRLHTAPFGWVGKRHSCPYHGWSYDFDGTLREVPDRERFGDRLDCAERSLKPVRVESWAGLVWINLDPDAPPLAAFLGSIMTELQPYNIDRMRLVRDQTCTLDANWKTVIDNFSEVYHVDFIHAQHASFSNCRDTDVGLYPFGHTVVRVEGYVLNPRYPLPTDPPPILAAAMQGIGLDPDEFSGRVGEVRQASQVQKRALAAKVGLDCAELTYAQLTDIWQFNIFPNIIMTVKPEEVWIMRPRPHPDDPGKCLFDKLTLAMPLRTTDDGLSPVLMGDPAVSKVLADGTRPEREVFEQSAIVEGLTSMTETVDQDIQYLPDMQAGMLSAGFQSALLSDDEVRIAHMHDWLAVWLTSDPFLSTGPGESQEAKA